MKKDNNFLFWESALQKVLLYLARHSQTEFYGREAAVRSGVGKSAANYALRRLADLGWVTVRSSGRMKHYRAVPDHPAVCQVKITDTVMGLEGFLKKLRPLAVKIVLYGSAALGQDQEDSDVDVMVISNQPDAARRAALIFAPKIQTVVKDPVEWAGMQKSGEIFYREIERGIMLWQKM
ncbi:MAG: nucleotidyltransferase domain-containing protein [Candidatus Edwardsbacteria bacterium]|nr:nucleotidyltransferase domain-containing protein [Candidatus Edwardsbacteria bacterium]MBU2464663.1 nucleotidyltransferase domain-containing protein [Candidatus Edwardsbacteria bacterium]MBU2594219.1 nucleotidyltransferase domain-containing protein [Candidatus Edwardsbacteria bacterium]